ncbi:DUF3310 domain-containing protein [Staphylococcus sp. HMSC65H10]|uniref:DUF3310 domain-containing protein n=1 Tax=Staphylococcus sp. HMSC65H10 TaxID=1608889 RepID=UPI0008A84784|nr:DUF3310 domain-containing protein [Staphylococcus sp. HMSC65H10]OHS46892.1 hypothetical protein HMPREF3270_10995 [Staphylococcus sp. HMSC65H10]
MKVRDLNLNDRIIIWSDDGEEGKCGSVITFTYKNFTQETAVVLLDGEANEIELTDEDYFDRLPTSFKKAEHFEDCKNNSVHQPNHYQFGQFTAAMIIELVGSTYKSASVFYHVGNALKYLMRAPRKNGLQDLKKAKQSIEFAIECWGK